MSGDICWYCDGTGDRNPLSGAPCHECGGSGWKEEEEITDEERDELDAFWDEFHRARDESA